MSFGMTVASGAFQTLSTFLFALSAYFFGKWITDRASQELFETLGQAQVEKPVQESLEREYQERGYLDRLTGEIDYSQIDPREHSEPDRLEEEARDLVPSYADLKMRDMYLRVGKKRKNAGKRSKWLGVSVVGIATALLISSFFV